MSLASIRASLKSVLVRADCTDDQANGFILSGLRRIQNTARLVSMERLAIFQDVAPMTSIVIPADFIQPIDIYVPAVLSTPQPYLMDTYGDVASDGMVPLLKRTSRQIQAVPLAAPPTVYARFQSQFYIRGAVPANTPIKLFYYGAFSPFTSDASDNEITAANPDLVVYAGLTFAQDTFIIPSDRADRWESRYQELLSDVKLQSADIDNEGGPSVVSPTHET